MSIEKASGEVVVDIINNLSDQSVLNNIQNSQSAAEFLQV